MPEPVIFFFSLHMITAATRHHQYGILYHQSEPEKLQNNSQKPHFLLYDKTWPQEF